MLSGLVVLPVVRVDHRGVGWSSRVDIATDGDLDIVPFLRLELTQPAYSEPPPLRMVPEAARIAALGQAFGALLFDRVRPLARTVPAFSARPLSRCTVGDLDPKEARRDRG